MAFTPNTQKTNTTTTTFDPNRKYPEPKAGSRPARISLIVELGTQERPDFEDPKTKEVKPQKPCQQVAVFADLTHDVVDYGGEIGKQPYRLMLNKVFKGDIEGVNFTAVPPRDADGNMIPGRDWGFHPANLLSKVAKAVKKPEVITTMDVEQLLDIPFMAQVEVKKTESKDKKDDNGNPVVFTNINFKGANECPMIEDEDGNEVPMKVKPLALEAKCITFKNARKEDIKFIRNSLLKKIKLATDYEGSQMQRAIVAFEAEKNAQQEPFVEKSPAKVTTEKTTSTPNDSFDDLEDKLPF